MTNKEIFSRGKIIDKFIAVNPDDPDNDYTSCAIEYGSVVYEVIIDKNNSVLNPEETAVIISNSIKEITDSKDDEESMPLITFAFDKTDESDDSDFQFPNFIL